MTTLKIDATEDLPSVIFEDYKGMFQISKRSLPENAIVFFEPLIEYINEYIKAPKEETTVVFHFDYISTSSTKQIMKIILLFNELAKTKKVILKWNYDQGDTDMLQTGNRLEKLTNLKFVYTEV
ncbi:DUF1987 domain-containing protein [Sediminibacterium sp.]|uniref:DUF1987 domain-containing protein n=1 Tax=Sediminibacterium sp. TaxID=1917865 RepID=UPI0027156724|nr:DUF1987 domain-containing protein [Sediminibacterium sp.]MDO9000663.1 DUF1987 domain-containing protein [Bacteroidota bacterium]MDP3146769.1 DUF1987 domain-containing protein [Bacteroidota bacterium]MDP3567287.1 DUF1987 domain-containing protein [Sediminibacterium sp.]